MQNATLFLKVKERLNKLDSQDYDNIKCWQVVESFNKGQMAWVRRQIQGINILKVGDEQTIVKIDDLQNLLKTWDFTLINKGLYWESEEALPDDYMGFKRINALSKKECCEDERLLRVYLKEEINVPNLLNDELTKPSFNWGETFCTLVGNKIRIYTNNDFDIASASLIYYKLPTFIEIENCANPYDPQNQSQQNVECEFKDDIVELLIDECVSILASDIESVGQIQLAKGRNELNT